MSASTEQAQGAMASAAPTGAAPPAGEAAGATGGCDGLGPLKASSVIGGVSSMGSSGGAGGGISGSPLKSSPRATPTLTRSHTLGPSAASLEKERMEKPSALSRVFNPPKLERKHSSGDLHSRLKTRKILGVGETDNGDIHRSKISQVLGHNEHLYVKLPRGFWTAHVLMGVGVTMETALLLLTPSLAAQVGVLPPLSEDAIPASRAAGAALAGLCVFVWSLLGTSDKHYARTMLLSMLTYHVLAVCIAGASVFTKSEDAEPQEHRLAGIVGVRATLCVLCLAYFYSIGEPTFGIRKSTSYKDLAKDEHKKDN